jgi:hypothetical protein
MCYNYEIPSQEKLEEAQLMGDSSLLSSSHSLKIDAQFYEELTYAKEYNDTDIML